MFDAVNNKVEVAGKDKQRAMLIREGQLQVNELGFSYSLKTGEFSIEQPSGLFFTTPGRK